LENLGDNWGALACPHAPTTSEALRRISIEGLQVLRVGHCDLRWPTRLRCTRCPRPGGRV